MNNTTIGTARVMSKERIEYLLKLEATQKALNDEIKAIKNEFKKEMKAAGSKKVEIENYTITFSEYASITLDTKRIKEEFPEIYEEYGKVSNGERLTVKGSK